MYESVTYEEILQRMLDRIPDTVDKREGSIIYDALAPAAVELQNMYIEFDVILKETFAETASRDYLILRAAERGITPYAASKAVLKAESEPSALEIPIGSRFSLNDLNYIVTEKIQSGQYKVQCETAGECGNQYFGNMIPINYIDGLESIELTELLIPGEDEESDASIRERYFDTFDTSPFGGNVEDYIQKTNAISGVGSTKVTPVWNGGGTVLLTILNSQYSKASSTLVQDVQDAIDPSPQGQGNGIAPIGHTVTVRTADNVTINISTSITCQEGYTFDGLKPQIEAAMEAYLLEIRTAWADESSSVVRISQIETRILNITGIIDVTNTKINSVASNLALGVYEIPVLGVITNG